MSFTTCPGIPASSSIQSPFNKHRYLPPLLSSMISPILLSPILCLGDSGRTRPSLAFQDLSAWWGIVPGQNTPSVDGQGRGFDLEENQSWKKCPQLRSSKMSSRYLRVHLRVLYGQEIAWQNEEMESREGCKGERGSERQEEGGFIVHVTDCGVD